MEQTKIQFYYDFLFNIFFVQLNVLKLYLLVELLETNILTNAFVIHYLNYVLFNIKLVHNINILSNTYSLYNGLYPLQSLSYACQQMKNHIILLKNFF